MILHYQYSGHCKLNNKNIMIVNWDLYQRQLHVCVPYTTVHVHKYWYLYLTCSYLLYLISVCVSSLRCSWWSRDPSVTEEPRTERLRQGRQKVTGEVSHLSVTVKLLWMKVMASIKVNVWFIRVALRRGCGVICWMLSWLCTPSFAVSVWPSDGSDPS